MCIDVVDSIPQFYCSPVFEITQDLNRSADDVRSLIDTADLDIETPNDARLDRRELDSPVSDNEHPGALGRSFRQAPENHGLQRYSEGSGLFAHQHFGITRQTGAK